MIVGREREMRSFEALLTGLRRGEGCGLAVHGAPRIGKTTLLAALTGRAGDGVTVLRVCGVQTEARLGFSALADLLAPVLDRCDALPPLQAAALLGALALGPPVPGARLAVCVATVGVLRAVAARCPVLVVVDDLHWVDAPSREVIRYAARRASGRLAVVTAERQPAGPPERTPVGEIRLGPLDDAAAAALLRGLDPELAPAVVTALVRAAAGNPLALVDLPLTLRPGQRSGREPLDHPLGPGFGLRQAFEQRTSGLSEPARLALLVAAAHDGTELSVIASACRHLGTHVDRLGEAEACHLVRVGTGTVVFAHPLLRGLIYQRATATDRRAAHAALAATLTDDRRPWHLAAATVGPDEHVAAELERVGRTAPHVVRSPPARTHWNERPASPATVIRPGDGSSSRHRPPRAPVARIAPSPSSPGPNWTATTRTSGLARCTCGAGCWCGGAGRRRRSRCSSGTRAPSPHGTRHWPR